MDKNILKQKYKDEEVYVIPYNELQEIQNGFSYCDSVKILKHFDTKGKYIKRYDAEYNTALKQIIPYSIIVNNEGRFFVTKRINGESRLLSKYSIACGGHINPIDGSNDIINNALIRELNEELYLDNDISSKFIGFVQDVTSKTNEHLGCVFITKTNNVSIKEKDTLVGYWYTRKQLVEDYFKFEGWSQHIINFLESTAQENIKQYNILIK